MIRTRQEEEIIKFVRDKKHAGLATAKISEMPSSIIRFQFSHLLNGYAQAYNKRYKRKGSLFIPNLKRKEVKNENYFTQLIGYIHNNPVRYGFCDAIDYWPHSSIHAYISTSASKINRKYMEKWFGNKDRLLHFHKHLKPKNDFLNF